LLTLTLLLAIFAQLLAPIIAPPPTYAAEAERELTATIGGSPPPATLGEPYSYQFRVGGDPRPVIAVDSGSLPLGLSLSPDGLLSGTPVNGGTYSFTIWAGGEFGIAATHPVTLEVLTPAPAAAPAAQPAAGADPAALPAAPSAPIVIAPDGAAAQTEDPSPFAGLAEMWGVLTESAGSFFSSFGAPSAAAAPLQGAAPAFSAPTALGGSLPTQVVAADFDGDGKLDLAASNFNATTVTVWRNTTATGAATPSFAQSISLPIPGNVTTGWGIVAAEFSGDGRPDLALADGTRQVVVWTNATPGAGQSLAFGATPVTFPAGVAGPRFLATGDFNQDGKADLAVSGYNGGSGAQISVLLSDRAPTAASPSFSPYVAFAVPAGPAGLVAVDLNGDNRHDLAIATAGSLHILLNTTAASATAPSFAAGANFALPAAGWGLAAADLNNDGRRDVVVGHNAGTANASAFINSTASGAPTPSFQPRTDIGAGSSGFRDAALADLNADGRIDVASRATSASLRVFASTTANGAGAAAFQAPLALSAGAGEGGITIVDLNGDGKPDLVAPNAGLSNLSLFMNITGPPPTATPTKTTTPTNTPTATATATATATVTSVPPGPQPGPIGTRDIGAVRIWATSFVEAGGQTTATGSVGVGPKSAAAPYYTVSASATWTSSGAITLGGLGIPGGPDLASGQLSVDRASGAVTWQPGSQATLSKLGDSGLSLSNVSITVNVLQPSASVAARIAFDLPENAGKTLDVTYTLGQGGAISGGPAPLSLSAAGLSLTAAVAVSNAGLSAPEASLKLPAAWGGASVSVNGIAISGAGIQLAGAGGTFPIPDQTLGKAVKLSGMTGKLSYNPNTSSYNLAITAATVTFTAGAESAAANDVLFTVAGGNISATLGAMNLKIAGLNVAVQQLGYNGGLFSTTSAVLTLPTVWKGANVTINGVAISNDAVSLGGAGGTFPIPDQTLGKVVGLTGMSGKVNIDGAGAYTIAVTVGSLIFTVGSDSSTISNTVFSIANGAVSAVIGTAALKVAGLNVTASNLAYANGTFAVGGPGAGSVTLSLPGAWKGASISIEGLAISADSFSLGGAGGTFPIPDQTLGKAIKLTGMTGKVNVNLNTNAYTIGITAGSVVFTAGSSSASALNGQFTIAGGNVSGSVGNVTLTIAGLNVSVTQISYANAAFSAGSATISFPSVWNGASATVSGLKITNDLISIGGAGSTFTIPTINLGGTGVLSLTQNKGSLALDADGQYKFSVSSVVSVSKVQTSGGGSNLTVAGTLTIKNGAVSGSISSLAFKVSGVDFKATNMQFVGDKLTVAQASLSLSIAGKTASATVYGLELGGSVGFKFTGAQITLPDFTIGTVGVKGVMISFTKGADGSYTVAGKAKFVFTQFTVDGSFKIGYAPATGVSLKSVSLTFTGSLPNMAIPLGNTGFAIIKISGAFDMSSGSTTISIGLGAASYAGVGQLSILALDASVTLTIKPSFSLKASAGAKVVGLQVANVDLYVSPTAFSLNGKVQVAIIQASLEITFGMDSSNQFTFYGKVMVAITVPEGYICNTWPCIIPWNDMSLASARLDGGKFKKGTSVIWGARGMVEVLGFDAYAWAKFSPGPTDWGLGKKLESYTPVRPVGLAARQAGFDPYLVEVTGPAEYLVFVDGIAEPNRPAPQEMQIVGPRGVGFTKRLAGENLELGIRIYRVDLADPQDAVGTWALNTQAGNTVVIKAAIPAPQMDSFSACAGATCLVPGASTELSNGQALDIAWSARATEPGMALELYAESGTGKRYPIAGQETATEKTLAGATTWTLGLPSGTYTVTTQVEADGFAPVTVNQGVIVINDTTPPAAPKGLAAVAAGDMSARATWDGAAAEPDVMGYQFTVNNGDPISIDGRLADYITYGLAPGQSHTISVAAYDMSGNVGPAATATVTAPSYGVASAWPLSGSREYEVTEVGASFTGPVTLGSLELFGPVGAKVDGAVTPLAGEVAEGESVIVGATFAPASGRLPDGVYSARVRGSNPATGAEVVHEWSFFVGQAGGEGPDVPPIDPPPAPARHYVYLPLLHR